MSQDNVDKRIRDSYNSIESNLSLVGATGIEDRLQEGVPDTLNSLISAGIVVWVLTGDKPETAINIAYSAKLFSPHMELLKLMARSKEAAEHTINFYLSEIERSLGGEYTEVAVSGRRGNRTAGGSFSARSGRTRGLVSFDFCCIA